MNSNNVLSSAPDLQSLQFALRASGLGTWDISLSKPWAVTWDKRCRELFGISDETEITFQEGLRYIHPNDRESVRSAVLKALDPATEGSYDMTFRVTSHDNTIRWVRFIGKRYSNSSGIPERFAGVAMDVTTEKVATQKLEAAENLAHIAIKGFGVGLFHIDLETDHIDYSPAFAVLVTGENNRNLTRKDFIGYIHPDDQKLRDAAYNTASRIGDLFYEARVTWKDGSIHWIRTVGTYSFDDSGKPVAFSGTVQDITEQRLRQLAFQEAENRFSLALKQSEAMFRNVTSTSPTGLWMADEEGRFTYLNKTLQDWTGLEYESLLGRGWTNALIAEDRAYAVEEFRKSVLMRGHYDVEFRLRKNNGQVIWCRAAGDPYYREDGSYAGYVGFCMDINEGVLNANRLKVSEERLRAIIQQAPVAIGLLNGRDMVLETANETILRLWGKNESILGMPLIKAIPEIKGQSFVSYLEAVYDSGQPYVGYSTLAQLEHHGKLKDFYFDFVYHPMRNTEDVVTGVMIIATDVTTQVLARKAVEDSERRFRALIEEAPIATTLFRGRNHVIEMANEAILRLWGKDNRVIGLPLQVALPELKGQPFLDILDDVFSTGKAYHAQEAQASLMVNGELKSYYFNFTYKPLKDEKGEIYATLNMAIDVTEQVDARKKTEESDLFARSIINNSPVAKMVFVGKDMVVSTVNENMLKMLGRDVSIIGQPFMTAVPELIGTPTLDRLRNVLATGETFYQPEEQLELLVNGKPYTRYYNYIYKALPNLAGEYYGVIFTATEVTDQVLARKQIMETEESLRGAIELAELGTWSVNMADGHVNFSDRL
ncbi:MAG TPA: PAS domain S-box protein, partial [Chitinophagaceae bacterium]|nr:PAS domain S-box protein [Chitinophagaceae bacterium]